jgi:hypothetical protein
MKTNTQGFLYLDFALGVLYDFPFTLYGSTMGQIILLSPFLDEETEPLRG